jgi:CRP/FNR family transcriptional regulator
MKTMESLQSLVEKIRTVKHFQTLSLTDLLTIVSAGQVRHFQSRQTIFSEGDPCSGMYVLLHGRVHLCKFGRQGQMNIIAVIEPVIMFNEVAALDGGKNPLTAIATEDSLLWQIGHAAFQDLLKRIPQIGLSLLSVLAKRNRQMIAHFEDLSFRTVTARTAKLLLDLSEAGRKPIDRHNCSIREMANRIATVPEAISRSLNSMKNQGLISTSRTEIVILSVRELAELAQINPVPGEEN